MWTPTIINGEASSASWVENNNGEVHRTLVTVHPIVGDNECLVCHQEYTHTPANVYGLAVSRIPLQKWDAATADTESDVLWSSMSVALCGTILLLGIIFLFRRRKTP